MVVLLVLPGTAAAQVGVEPWLRNGAVVVVRDPRAGEAYGKPTTDLIPARVWGSADLPTHERADYGESQYTVNIAPIAVSNIVQLVGAGAERCTCTWFGMAHREVIVGLAPSEEPGFEWRLVGPLLSIPHHGRDWILDEHVGTCAASATQRGEHCAALSSTEGRRYFRGARPLGRRLERELHEAVYLHGQPTHTVAIGRGLARDLDRSRRWGGEISERRFLARLDRSGGLRWAIDWGLVPEDAVPWDRDRGRPDEWRRVKWERDRDKPDEGRRERDE